MAHTVSPRRPTWIALCIALEGATISGGAFAHGPEHTSESGETSAQSAEPADAVVVTIAAEKPASESASSLVVGHRELDLRPRARSGDVVEAVPGLFAVQHAGGGKANQFFLRGFDADHGTDIAFSVDGVPVNLPSHGHGQGYADLHFVIPELVMSVEAQKGPYYADAGDFATAGSVKLHLASALEEGFAAASVGQFGQMRAVAAVSPSLGETTHLVAAFEAAKQDGPFEHPEGLERMNLYVRGTTEVGRHGEAAVTWMSYRSSWNSSGQLPVRAVCGAAEANSLPPSAYGQPCIDRFGSVDPSEGGNSTRHSFSTRIRWSRGDTDFEAIAYAVRYGFRLRSNFTLFRDDPVHGDAIEQRDDRAVSGVDLHAHHRATIDGHRLTTTIGTAARIDDVANGLEHVLAGQELQAVRSDDVRVMSLSPYVSEDVRLNRFVRLILGVRAERIDGRVSDTRIARPAGASDASGAKSAALLLPKAMAVVSPTPRLDLFADAGRGFHSNDVRGAVLDVNPARLITPAIGYEAGVRLRPFDGLVLSSDACVLDLDSELTWSGDEGTTEPAGRTRRTGVELSARYRVQNVLFADVDATFVRARFRDGAMAGAPVPLAPTRTLSAGIGARPTFGSWTPFAAVRLRSIDARPANADGSLQTQGFTLVDANAGLRFNDMEVALDAQNVLGTAWNEVELATLSRLAYEPRAIEGLHATPGWPRTILGRASIAWR